MLVHEPTADLNQSTVLKYSVGTSIDDIEESKQHEVKWCVGSMCDAVFGEDSLWYSAEVTEISQDDDGNKMFTVCFINYNRQMS